MTSSAPYLLRTGKTPEPKPAERSLLVRVLKRFSQELVLLFSLMALAVWLITLLSHHPADPAWSTTGSRDLPSNWLGQTGALISDISLFFLGRSVWMLFLALALAWLRLLRGWAHARQSTDISPSAQLPKPTWAQRLWRSRTAWCIALFLLLLACCVLEWSRFYDLNPASLPNGAGGVLGALIGPVALRWLGFTGSAVIAIMMLLGCMAWVFRFSWLRVAESLGARIESWFTAARERREMAHDLAVGKKPLASAKPWYSKSWSNTTKNLLCRS